MVVRVRWQRNVVNNGAVVFDIMLSGRNSSGVEEYVEVKRVRNSTGVFGVVEVIDVEVNSGWIREGGVFHYDKLSLVFSIVGADCDLALLLSADRGDDIHTLNACQ